MYFVLTTQDTADLVPDANTAVVRLFHIHVTQNDFPLRIISRMVIVRAIMDFLFLNQDQLNTPAALGPNLADIAEKQWEAAFVSWKKLRNAELSEPYIRLWLQSALAGYK